MKKTSLLVLAVALAGTVPDRLLLSSRSSTRFLSPVMQEGMLPERLFVDKSICSMYPDLARPHPRLKFPVRELLDKSRNCKAGAVESASEIFWSLQMKCIST